MNKPRPKGIPTVKIDNERVKVTEWCFSPGAETGHHRHEMDYIVVPLTTGNLLIVDSDGKETVAELTAGEPYFREVGVEHNVINDSNADFSFIEIELV